MMAIRHLLAFFLLALISFQAVTIGSTGGPAGETVFSYDPIMAMVHVLVTYEDGGPAANARVYINNDYNAGYGGDYYITDVNGKADVIAGYEDMGPCFITAMNVSLTTFFREDIYIVPGDDLYRNIVLAPPPADPLTLQGHVYNASDRDQPLENAPVSVFGVDKLGRNINRNAITDVAGFYQLALPELSDLYMYNLVVNSPPSGRYESYVGDIFFANGQTVKDMDLWLRPYVPMGVPLNIRFIDADLGTPLDGYVNMEGRSAGWDNMGVSSTYDSLSSDGWVNYTLNRGEYSFDWECDLPAPASMNLRMFFDVVLNDTSMELIVPVEMPKPERDVTVTVVDDEDSSPIESAYVNYGMSFDQPWDNDLYLRCTCPDTDMSGQTTFQIVADRDVSIYSYASNYEQVFHTIPAAPAGSSANIEIRLPKWEDTDLPYPTGNVSVLVRDRISGTPMPYANVRAYRYFENETFYGFSGQCNVYGYLNITVDARAYDLVKASCALGNGSITDLTVPSGSEVDAIIEIDRRVKDTTPFEDAYILIKDGSGAPVEGLKVEMTPITETFAYTRRIASGSDGSVWFSGRPGEYSFRIEDYVSYYHNRVHWKAPSYETRFTLPTGGGYLGDLTVYPTYPLTELSGSIMDEATLEPLPSVNVYSTSSIYLAEDISGGTPTRQGFGPYDYDPRSRMDLYYQETGSDRTGYYRVWGRDVFKVEATKDGYFPERIELDPGTRAPISRDIMMEKVPEPTTQVSGVLVDDGMNPLEGLVEVLDPSHNYYSLNVSETGSDGRFTMGVTPGTYMIGFRSGGYQDDMTVTVPSAGLDDMVLVLIPKNEIWGRVRDWSGALLQDINVTLVGASPPIEGVVSDWDLSREFGSYMLRAPAGTFRLVVEADDTHDSYESAPFESVPGDFIELNIVLENRTWASVTGTVTSAEGPLTGALADCPVTLTAGSSPLEVTTTNGSGIFVFGHVPYGSGYDLMVDPPLGSAYDEVNSSSGYLPGRTGPFIVTGVEVVKDIELEYKEFIFPGYLNVTSLSPSGSEVPLNEPIRIVFSMPVDISLVPGMVDISPELVDETYIWGIDNTSLTVGHSGFSPFTMYTVIISRELRSAAGWPMFGSTDRTFSFTTGNETVSWALYPPAVVLMGEPKEISISVLGLPGIDVYVRVMNGSLPQFDECYMMPEVGPGSYEVTLPETDLEYNTTYAFYFTNIIGGDDLAPSLAGTFTTGPRPGVIPGEWRIDDAEVVVNDDDSWTVTVEGAPDMDIYIVISKDGRMVGCVKLTETTPGEYVGTVPSDRFEEDGDYSYWFSDEYRGTDKAPSFSGVESVDVDEGKDRSNAWVYVCCITLAVAVMVILLVLVLLLLVLRKKGATYEE